MALVAVEPPVETSRGFRLSGSPERPLRFSVEPDRLFAIVGGHDRGYLIPPRVLIPAGRLRGPRGGLEDHGLPAPEVV